MASFIATLKHRWFAALAAAILIAGAALALLLRGNETGAPEGLLSGSGQSVAETPGYQYDPSKYPQGETLTIGTDTGAITVKNFYRAAAYESEGGAIVLVERDTHFISYDVARSRFWIAITEAPFASFRKDAESDFLAILGVGQRDACKLDVAVGAYENAASPGRLSFCVD